MRSDRFEHTKRQAHSRHQALQCQPPYQPSVVISAFHNAASALLLPRENILRNFREVLTHGRVG
jgi:hypothetical protein